MRTYFWTGERQLCFFPKQVIVKVGMDVWVGQEVYVVADEHIDLLARRHNVFVKPKVK